MSSSMNGDRRTIDLLKGYPNPSLLPAKAISTAAVTALAKPAVSTPALLYGADEGYEPFRRAIADWNKSFYGGKSSKDRVVISGGASQNLACVLQVFTDPMYTQHVWISSPAYMLVFRMFQDNGFADKLRAVPEVRDGLDVEWLERELEKCEIALQADPDGSQKMEPERPYSKYFRHLIYCVPTFSNPSSSIMSLAHREALMRCARKYDALVVADDVYDHLQWSSRMPAQSSTPLTKALLPRLSDIDAELDGGYDRPGADGFGNAMSNGSFSKICGPGVRCGWTEASPKLAFGVSQVGSSRSGGAPSQLVSTFLMEMLSSGWLSDHIFNTLQPEYSERYHILSEALTRYLVPLGCVIVEPEDYMGGFFIWVKLPKGVDADELASRCKTDEDLIIISGSLFEVPCKDKLRHNDSVRLCFSWEDKSLLAEGAQRLAHALSKRLI